MFKILVLGASVLSLSACTNLVGACNDLSAVSSTTLGKQIESSNSGVANGVDIAELGCLSNTEILGIKQARLAKTGNVSTPVAAPVSAK